MNKDEDNIYVDDDDDDDDDDEDNDDNDDDDEVKRMKIGGRVVTASNVIGTTLCECCSNVSNTGIGAGYFRNGYCIIHDFMYHDQQTICCELTTEFLEHSKSIGLDFETPERISIFPGVKHGEKWCLTVDQWNAAYCADVAPKVLLRATHEQTLRRIPYTILKEYAIDETIATEELDKLNKLRDRLNKLLE